MSAFIPTRIVSNKVTVKSNGSLRCLSSVELMIRLIYSFLNESFERIGCLNHSNDSAESIRRLYVVMSSVEIMIRLIHSLVNESAF